MNTRRLVLSLLIVLTGSLHLPGQLTNDRMIYEIKTKIDQQEWYDALDYINQMMGMTGKMRMLLPIRAMVYENLNDRRRSTEDIRLGKRYGAEYLSDFAEYLIDPEYFANTIAREYLDSVHLTAGNGYKPPFTRKDSLRGALRFERQCYDVGFYDLSISVNPGKKEISGSSSIMFTVLLDTRKIQIDLASSLAISSVRWKNREIKFDREFNAVFLNFPDELKSGAKDTVEIFYSGKPRVALNPPWNGGFVWDRKKGKDWIGVACEHLGASSWWPCKDHLSDRPDSMNITIIAPPGLVAISNGNLCSVDKQPESWKYKWHVSYPIASYLVTLYLGNFVNISEKYTNQQGSYAMDFYVLPQSLKKASAYYVQMKKIVEVYEHLFGEYPFIRDGIGMVEAPYAGMENQGAIAIGDEYGKKKRRSYEQLDYDYLLIHETAHEWWGNAVGMEDMADAWISESFATYSEYLFMEQVYGYNKYQDMAAENMGTILNIWPMAGVRDVNDNTFLGGDIYDKGATMLHNLRCLLDNDSLFFRTLKNFNLSHRNQVLTTNDCIQYFSKATGRNLTPFFEKFLYGTSPPILSYSFIHEGKDILFVFRWEEVKPGFVMPFLLITDAAKQIRLTGTTGYQSVRLTGANSFTIVSSMHHPATPLKNSMTWFWTSYNKAREEILKDTAGMMIARGYLIDTLKTGTWKIFNADRSVKDVYPYLNGRINGTVFHYTELGIPVSEETFRNDTLHGRCVYYHESGKLRATGSFFNSAQDSLWEFFSPDGQLAGKGKFVKGTADESSWHYFDASGGETKNESVSPYVSITPQYIGGEKKMYEFVRSHMPPLSEHAINGTPGKTYIRFTVTGNGTLKDFEIVKADSPELANAIIESIKKMNCWMPGYLNGEIVSVKVVLPFRTGGL